MLFDCAVVYTKTLEDVCRDAAVQRQYILYATL